MFRWIALLLCCVPLQVLALSCLPWNVDDALIKAVASERSYLPVVGRLTFDEDRLPKVDWNNQQDTPSQTLLPAHIEGHAWNGHAVAAPFDRNIELEVLCAGPWCAGAESGSIVLGILEQTQTTYRLSTHPCGGMLFSGEAVDLKKRVRVCLTEHDCQPSERR